MINDARRASTKLRESAPRTYGWALRSCQGRTSFAIVGNTLFFAELFDTLFYIQGDAYLGDTSFLKFPN